MEAAKEKKNIKEVFKDYNSTSFELNAAIVEEVNLYKKRSILELKINSDKHINIKEISQLEQYIEKRFQIKEASIIVNLKNTENSSNSIQEEWEDIIEYIARKHPIAKAFLKGSNIQIENKTIKVSLRLSGKEFLESNKFNEVFSKIIKNIYQDRYKVEYIENVSSEDISKIKERTIEQEKQVILNALQEVKNIEQDTNKKAQEFKKVSSSSISKPKYDNQNKENIQKTEEAKNNNINKAEKTEPIPEITNEEEETPLIYGRSLNLKEQLTKIQDIGVESGNVLLQGKILKVKLDDKDDDINLDIKVRELKNGKFLVIFSVYDGTGTIDCKVFAQADKVDKIKKRLKNAPEVRIAGTAQFDPYAKQLGILANTILEMPEL